jgi:hypothetical protein
MFGNKIPDSPDSPYRSVIGEIETTDGGNIALRIGREHDEGWQQTEQVTLTRKETGELMLQLSRMLSTRSTRNQHTVKFDRELAQAVLDRLNGNTVANEKYDRFQERLAQFIDGTLPL